MGNLWFSSDFHLDHANVIRHCNRPYAHVDEMNEALIQNWNTCVAPEDEGYLLGDMVWKGSPGRIASLMGRLNGKLHLIVGNHDRKYKRRYQELGIFEWVTDYEEINVKDPDFPGGNMLIILCHYPLASWRNMSHGSWLIHGHTHGNFPDNRSCRRLDVGVDTHSYMPYSLEELKEIMNQRPEKPRYRDMVK